MKRLMCCLTLRAVTARALTTCALTWGLLWLANVAGAGEIGFIEDFSLTTDRSVPLEQLIPGTED